MAFYIYFWKYEDLNKYAIKIDWVINWIKNWPIIEANGLKEKKDWGSNSLLSCEAGKVMLIVIKIGKVTIKS